MHGDVVFPMFGSLLAANVCALLPESPPVIACAASFSDGRSCEILEIANCGGSWVAVTYFLISRILGP